MAAKKKKKALIKTPRGYDPTSEYIENIVAKRFFDNVDSEKLELYMTDAKYSDPTTGQSKYDDYLRSFGDPAFNKLSPWSRMRKFSLTLHELQVIYTDGQRHLGLLEMSNQLPRVMSDTSKDALNRNVSCPRCDGNKLVKETVEYADAKGTSKKGSREKPCPECKGQGEVEVSGDHRSRELVFEAMKLTKQPGGPLVAIQQNVTNNSGLDSSLEDLLKLTQSITIGAKVIPDNQQ